MEKFANNFETTLAAAVTTTSATTLTTAAAAPAALQTGEFRILIDSEIMRVVSGQSGTAWTVERGLEGTAAATHSNAAPVVHELTAESLGLSAPRPAWVPSDNGLLASNMDPGEATSQVDGAVGEILWSKVWVPQRVTVANLVVMVSSPGDTLSSGNFGGLYSSAGTLIAKTAEQSTNWATAQTWSMALTAEAGQSLTFGGPGMYVIAAVMSRATVNPLFKSRLVEDKINLNLSGLSLRCASDYDTSRTALPSSLAAGSQSGTFRPVWVGLT